MQHLHLKQTEDPMQRILSLITQAVLLFTAGLIIFPMSAAFAAKKPNIVIMLSDNLGYGDLGSYGGGLIRGAPTPQLDKLAAEGTRFTNFNTETECTPSRSALMTGRYAVRSGTLRAVGVPGLPGGLPSWEVTIAEVLSEEGYDTAIYGKWHLGSSDERAPTNHGFDEWWGFPFSTDVTMYQDSYKRYKYEPGLKRPPYIFKGRKGKKIEKVKIYDEKMRPHIDRIIAEKSVNYIKKHAKSKKPFFLYIPWSLVHHPSIPHPDFVGKSLAGRYAEAVMEHDHRVGQVLSAIDEAGIADNTIVIYASDNGPDRSEYPYVGDSGPFRGYLGTIHEGSIRTPMIMRWLNKIPAGRVTNEIVAIHDFFPTLANLVGGEIPDDRAMDGKDQMDFFLGKKETSARESLLYFSGDTLMGMKWRQFKIYVNGENAGRTETEVNKLWKPRIYSLLEDPKEMNDIAEKELWILEPLFKEIMPFVYSVDKYGLVEPGGEKPSRHSLKMPFFTWEQMELSLSALKKQYLKKKVTDAVNSMKSKIWKPDNQIKE